MRLYAAYFMLLIAIIANVCRYRPGAALQSRDIVGIEPSTIYIYIHAHYEISMQMLLLFGQRAPHDWLPPAPVRMARSRGCPSVRV